jgi:uncharacterized membrane protein
VGKTGVNEYLHLIDHREFCIAAVDLLVVGMSGVFWRHSGTEYHDHSLEPTVRLPALIRGNLIEVSCLCVRPSVLAIF